MLRNKLVITLTTAQGSRQYTLGQITKYLLAVFLVISVCSFFVSNLLLVKTTDHLLNLEEGFDTLSLQYEDTLGASEQQKGQLDQLSRSLSQLQVEKKQLKEENLRIGELNAVLDASLYGLEGLLGLPASDEMTPERAGELSMLISQRTFYLNSIPNGLPIQGIRISGKYGMRMHPVLDKRTMHYGIDFKADKGTPIYATADGAVEFAGYNKQSGFGKLIILQHGFGFKTYYAHLNDIKIKSGQFVSKGQLIGLSGNTGRSTGPHLHYEIRHLFRPVDPAPFVAWDMSNFDSLFSTVKGIEWASLKKMYPLNQTLQTAKQ
ncbi:M23 family metallopeptidase [Aliamphritea spongicola]|uniref:M23 family metallopeptidase n=1 Tax=Aliamphritea spongicola TaxID=707589 RepID=UPI00196AC972|nr:M23 family metallopeptidase [Aliamphritea spongicola]MBN3563092.1 M23 family metallopeptidase [Aliamphritea spongicola]